MVEFALVAPLAFVLVLGVVVVSIVAFNQNRLTNTARDAARAAAVCGSGRAYATLPDTSACSDANAVTYATSELRKIDGSYSWSPTLNVVDQTGASQGAPGNRLSSCIPGYLVTVTAGYRQPLFVPFVGVLLGDPSSNTRTLQAKAEATCEQ